MVQSDRNRRNKKKGAKAEDIAAEALQAAGYACVEPIETGWSVNRRFDKIKGRWIIISARPKEKVSGDYQMEAQPR